MTIQSNDSTKFTQLRKRAEELIQRQPRSNLDVPDDVQRIIEELQIHQAELEIQNDELRCAQMELSALHEEYVDLYYDFAPSAYITLNPDGMITRINLTGVKMLGIEKANLENMAFSLLIDPVSEDPYFHTLKQISKTGDKQSVDLKLKTDAGATKWVRVDIQPDFDDAGKQIQRRMVLVDITEKKEAEALLLESEERFRELFEKAPLSYQSLDEKGNFLEVNETWLSTIGYSREEVIGRNFAEFLHPEWKTHFKENFPIFKSVGEVLGTEFVMRKQDGNDILVSFQGKIGRTGMGEFKQTHCVFKDITKQREIENEKEKLENQLRQAQKLESIGNLAGGIAHDFNNILASIIGFTELSLEEAESGSVQEDNLQEIYAAGKRAKNLVSQILAFARQTNEEVRSVNIRKISKEALSLLRSTIPANIEIKKSIKVNSEVIGNESLLEQVLLNLATNAVDAMEDDGGILSISVFELPKDDLQLKGFDPMGADGYVKIIVSDTGCGISPDVIGSVFEPYFTTKPIGKGTGLGLATVHGTVKKYGGDIRIKSDLGKGTAVEVILPVTKHDERTAKYQPVELPTGTEAILIIDDELPTVKMGKRILEGLGYKVITRTSSMEALELFRAKPDTFDLVITDMTMPTMTGDKLATELMKIRADIPVILCTGYSRKISDETASKIGIKAFAYKPIVKADLVKTVRKVLDEANS